MNIDSLNGALHQPFSITGTVSLSSLGEAHEHPNEHMLTLWAEYLSSQLKERLEDITEVEIRTAPIGGTRLVAHGGGLLPDSTDLHLLSDSILDDFCFNYDSIALHGMVEGFPKPGEEEC